MSDNEQASVSLVKIICILVIFMMITGISVMATNSTVKNVKIVLANNQTLDIVTTKIKVADILEENHIIVMPEEIVVPELENEITEQNEIKILKQVELDKKILNISEKEEAVTVASLMEDYSPIIEKIIVEQVSIPYETITKDVSEDAENKQNKVVQKGKEGLKEITARVKYQNDIEIDRIILSETIIREPINKIVEIRKAAVRASTERVASHNPALTASTTLAKKVEGITPVVATLNTSAYTASTCDKAPGSPGYGITASGARASAWYTVAAGKGYPMGTVMYIPYFSNQPNGGWFVVQDRGGAISNNKLDVYMDTYNECIQFGRRNLECYIYVQ
ncbi:MAG: G5 domain-containing protein [Clostridia bacterium]|nr:G5 domain-containing protein [Clostridia bacterium]